MSNSYSSTVHFIQDHFIPVKTSISLHNCVTFASKPVSNKYKKGENCVSFCEVAAIIANTDIHDVKALKSVSVKLI